MPFKKFYEVDFTRPEQASLILNTKNWPALQISSSHPPPATEHQWKPAGLDLKITRNSTDPTDLTKSVYVVPPGGITMSTRYLMKVTFLHPNANDPSGNPNLTPEAWAVGLRFSSLNDILDPIKSTIATCQFNRKGNSSGVRLNTPEGLQQVGEPGYLESPIDYAQYNPVPPHDIHNPAVVPVFTLEQSFCGINLNLPTNRHTAGAGFLKISRQNKPDAIDHRVFSRADITNGAATILAMGVNLATNKRIGWMSVRLLSFEIWEDKGFVP